MSSPTSTSAKLPAELYLNLLGYCGDVELSQVALVSKDLNRCATELLYRSPRLGLHKAFHFCATVVHHRVLAEQVRSFAIICGVLYPDGETVDTVYDAIAAMSNLRHFSCCDTAITTPRFWPALVECRSLRSFSVALGASFGEDVAAIYRCQPQFPSLASIAIDFRDKTVPKGLVKFLHKLLYSCAHQLRTLQLAFHYSGQQIAFMGTVFACVFPSLEHLTIPLEWLKPSVDHLLAPRVRTLTVRSEHDYRVPSFDVSDAFPVLESLECPSRVVGMFFRNWRSRPVRRVCIDLFASSREGGLDSMACTHSNLLVWDDVLDALKCISETPVYELSLNIGDRVFSQDLVQAAQYLGSIQELTLYHTIPRIVWNTVSSHHPNIQLMSRIQS